MVSHYHLGPGPRADPLPIVLLSCLSETVNDQLRCFSDRSVFTAFVALEFVLPSSLHERVQKCKLVCIQPYNELHLLQ